MLICIGFSKEYIVGGPAIIFRRYHEKDVTFLSSATHEQPGFSSLQKNLGVRR